MRKIASLTLLGSLALALSSCTMVWLPASDFPFESNWRRSSDGAYVFCTNKDSYIRYSIRVLEPERIQSITETYEGKASLRRVIIFRPITDLTNVSGRYVFVGKLTFGQMGVPQSLQPFSIVVTPEFSITDLDLSSASKNGQTKVTVDVTSTTGVIYRGSYTYDTYANCP